MDTDAGEFIGDLDGGVFADKLGRVLSHVAGSVMDHKGGGKITITMDVNRFGSGQQVLVKHKLVSIAPTLHGKTTEEDTTETPMHVGRGGRMSLFPEDQTQMFGKQGEPATEK